MYELIIYYHTYHDQPECVRKIDTYEDARFLFKAMQLFDPFRVAIIKCDSDIMGTFITLDVYFRTINNELATTIPKLDYI